MAAASPTLFEAPRIRTIDPITKPGELSHFETETSRTAITAEPRQAWTLIRPTLEEIARVARRRSEHTPFSTLARVEGFRIDRLQQQGMALYGVGGELALHAQAATINQGREQLTLCENIVRALDIDLRLLHEIRQKLQAERDYLFIFSREKHETGPDGKEVIVPSIDVEPEWVGWTVH